MKRLWFRLKAWWYRHRPTKRKLVQVYAALLFNANLKGFVNGTIFTGDLKVLCGPGMNCYSCPGAVVSCPLGSLQSALSSQNKSAFYYVMGIILLYGLIFGRTICGWLCPFGLIQEWLYSIKTKKIHKGKATRILSYFKYVALFVFVFGITLAFASNKAVVPGFCKYLCPAGTLEGAYPLAFNHINQDIQEGLAALFSWKSMLTVSCIVLSILLYRPFCRFLCPLGAIYGFFNDLAIIGVHVEESKCVDCGLCVSTCKMDVKRVGDHECIDCGECIEVCPTHAISFKGPKNLFRKKEATSDEKGL